MFGASSISLKAGSSSNISCNEYTASCRMDYVQGTVYQVNLAPGTYRFDVSGASGGSQQVSLTSGFGGNGGFSTGVLTIVQSLVLYAYIGGAGQSYTDASGTIAQGGWNGGGSGLSRHSTYGGPGGGGGASDLCTVYSAISYSDYKYIRSDESYRSRFIVGSGGGGAYAIFATSSNRISSDGGCGGGTISQGGGYAQTRGCGYSSQLICDYFNSGSSNDAAYNSIPSSTQSSAGVAGNHLFPSNVYLVSSQTGVFGYGGNAMKYNTYPSGGGGGAGWFGGTGGVTGLNTLGTGGAGGTGYVHTTTNSYSSLDETYFLSSASTFHGNTTYGNNGNGYIVITSLGVYNHPTPTQAFQAQVSCRNDIQFGIYGFVFLLPFLLLEFTQAAFQFHIKSFLSLQY